MRWHSARVGSGETAGAAAGGAVVEGPEVNWRLATSFPPSLDILHGAGVRIAERVSELTGGNFTIRVYAANELVPALQVMDAVMQGTDPLWSCRPATYYVGKHPALAFRHGDPVRPHHPPADGVAAPRRAGSSSMNSIYADFGIRIDTRRSRAGGQMGGWFREPVGSLAGALRAALPDPRGSAARSWRAWV